MVRNILAVLAGFVAWTVLWLASNAAVAAVVPSAFGEDGSTDSAGILVLFLALLLPGTLFGAKMRLGRSVPVIAA